MNFEQKGLCSMFLIELEEGRKAYRYDVQINSMRQGAKSGEPTKFTRRGADDAQQFVFRRICHLLLKMAIKRMCPELDGQYVYDGNRTLFAPLELELGKNEIIFGRDEVDEFVRVNSHPLCKEFAIGIWPNLQRPTLDIATLLNAYKKGAKLEEEDRSLRTFMELATSQNAINHDLYFSFGTKLYENGVQIDMENMQEIVLKNGISKGIRVVENFGNPTLAIVIDATISPFFVPMDLKKFVKTMLGGKLPQQMEEWTKLEKELADLRVNLKYATHRSFGFGRFTQKPLAELSATLDGKTIPLSEYFERQKGIHLRHLELPAIISNMQPKGANLEAFPLEELAVMEAQRVPREKMTKELEKKLAYMNTMYPEERLAAILRHADKMGLFDENNKVMRAFGIRILRNSNQALFKLIPPPKIRYDNNVLVEPNRNKAEWRQSSMKQKYLATRPIGKWAVICDQRFVVIAKNFIQIYLDTAKMKGMKFAVETPPIPIAYLPGPDGIDFEKQFEKCVAEKMEFILLIDYKREKTSHGLLKLLEAENKILTQHISLESIEDVVQHKRMQILDNILAKTNCKNFGLNYAPTVPTNLGKQNSLLNKMEEGKLLVIGYDVAHPCGLSPMERRMLKAKGIDCEALEPSVVGICANMALHPHNFVGDYFYQQSRKESVNMAELIDRIQWILGNLAKNRPKHRFPPNILILRDGLSEGQFCMAIDEELNALKEGCHQFGAKNGIDNYKPKFTFVVGTKRHFKRFFAGQIPEKVRNLLPGSVMEKKFTRPDLPAEFFLQSQFAAKGTAKSVQYSVLANEVGIGDTELHVFLNALCHSHQIVPSATSLPEPIFQADELAKRGHQNFLTLKHFRPERIPHLEGGILVDMSALTDLLSYRNHPMGICTRFTA